MNATRRIKIESASVKMPQRIRLKGRWLEAAGFLAGGYVNVTVEAGRLTVTAERGAL